MRLRSPYAHYAFHTLGVLVLLATGVACDGGSPSEDDDAPTDPPRTLTLALLTAPTTVAEVAAVRATWSIRDTTPRNVAVEDSGSVTFGGVPMTYTVLSDTVGGARHVGAVLVPDALPETASAPVVVYAHGGYTGAGGFPYFNVEDLQFRIPGEPLRSRLVYVVPAYRGERIRIGGETYMAGGEASLGDFDVDDTMALLSVVLDRVPQADGARVAVFGESRGGLVALQMGARDERVDLVLDAYGPTDFRIGLTAGGVTEEVFQGALAQALADPDSPANLLIRSIIPLDEVSEQSDGSFEITAAGYRTLRENLARNAPIAYAADLPVTEVHHGVLDTTAPVAYSRALRDAMAAVGRPSPSGSFTYFEYPDGGHDLSTLPGSITRIGDAITRVLHP